MNGVLKIWTAAAFGLVVGLAKPQTAAAVDAKPLTIQEKWSVVGVITSSKPENDVAVLRNNETSKTYTVTLGDTLPSEYSFVLTEIKRRNVVISNGEKKVVLGFADVPVTEDDSDDFRNSVRFIDNYYRGLAESPIELFNKQRRTGTTGTAAVVNPVPVMPLKNFGSMDEARDSRFDADGEVFDPELFQIPEVFDETVDALQENTVEEDYPNYQEVPQEEELYYDQTELPPAADSDE
jgi:hypothetical protein